MRIRVMLSVGLSLVIACSSLAGDEWLTHTGRPHDCAVVKATVLSRTDERISHFEIEVQHVYAGSVVREGDRFSGETYERGNAFVLILHPTLSVGEEGIWLVPVSNQEIEPYWMARLQQIVPTRLPARAIGGGEQENYDNAVVWAEAVETLESLDEKDRIEKLEEYAATGHRVLTPWAINVLALERGNTEFLRKLARNRTLPVLGQVALDEVLAQLAPDDWLDSDERQEMLKSWQSVAVDEVDGLAIVYRIEQAIRANALEPQLAFQMLITIINSESSLLVRSKAINATRWITGIPDLCGSIFDELAQVLERDENLQMKNATLDALKSIESLDDERMARLILLRDAYLEKSLDIEDPRDPLKRIATTLDETVRRLQKPKRSSDARE